MIIERIPSYFRDHDVYRYDVLYRQDGMMKTAYTLLDPAVKEPIAILKMTRQQFKPDTVYFRPRRRNGSSTKFISDEIIVEFGDEATQKPVAAPSLPAGLAGFDAMPAQNGQYGSFLGQLNEFKYQTEKERREKAEAKLEKLEAEYEKLKAEHSQTKEALSFKDKEFDLALKEKDGEHKNSLNGLVGSLKDPETIAAIGAVLSQVNAMRSGQQALPAAGMAGIPEGISPDMLANPYVKDILQFFTSQSEPNQQVVYNLLLLVANKKVNPHRIVEKAQAAA